MTDGAGEEDVPDDVREQVLGRLLEAFPEAERREAMLRLLDQVEHLHRAHGAEPPGWIARLRARLGG
ncbi:MAG TPA: hypothetical protein VFX98_13975 [Longimicrobiaceae bacterium]|nr:hypothetical protein [Longimicrobiaceae bacterium]